MNWSEWLQARLAEGSTWTGIAMGFASAGASLAAAGMPRTGAVVIAIGAGLGAIGNVIAKEHESVVVATTAPVVVTPPAPPADPAS